MRCEDFREIADSFLSGELLVETNHEVVRHLENCEVCGADLEARRMFREKLRSAVINAPEAQIDAAFAARLKSDLKKAGFKENKAENFWSRSFSLKFLAAASAVLFITIAAAFSFLPTQDQKPEISFTAANRNDAEANDDPASLWQKIAYQAIGDHQHCGLEKMDDWQKAANSETAKKADFRENILEKVSFDSSEPMRLLHVHDCIYDRRIFTHAVIQIGNRTVSVLLTETELASAANINKSGGEPDSAITCQKQTGFQVASFVGSHKAVFVISDLSEAENLNLARSLSNAMQS